MQAHEAVTVVLSAVPEFQTAYDAGDYAGEDGEPMLHVVFGDLAIFYEEKVAARPELMDRFWRMIEELARGGGPFVADDALGGSFIEYFCRGDESQRRMIEEAAPQQGPVTRRLVEWYWRSDVAAVWRFERRRDEHRRRG